MTAAELREKNEMELADVLLGLYREAFNLRMQYGSGQQSKPTNRFKTIRRDIARIKTIINERHRIQKV